MGIGESADSGEVDRCLPLLVPGGNLRDMTVIARSAGPPTVTDARRAAEALVLSGAEEVLLFGSLARGEETEQSDIDLVAVFADIDYGRRRELSLRLEEAARRAVGHRPVQVMVTDRPEWRNRLANVSASFEAAISNDTVVIAESPGRGPVRWDKEMVLPMSNPDEALRKFADDVLSQLRDLNSAVYPVPPETDVSVPIENREAHRRRRMVRLCTSSALAVELALKSLAVLHSTYTPSEKALSGARHSIPACLALVPDPVRSSVASVVTARGLSYEELSRWRTANTYHEDRVAAEVDADRRAEDYRDTALDVSAFLLRDLRAMVGDTPAMTTAEGQWHDIAKILSEINIRTGRSRADSATPGLDL